MGGASPRRSVPVSPSPAQADRFRWSRFLRKRSLYSIQLRIRLTHRDTHAEAADGEEIEIADRLELRPVDGDRLDNFRRHRRRRRDQQGYPGETESRWKYTHDQIRVPVQCKSLVHD